VTRKETSQLLAYDNTLDSKSVECQVELLLNAKKGVEVRYDLMDTHIDICSPKVLMLFTENFDWRDRRRNLMQGVLQSKIGSEKIYAHVVRGDYAARVHDLRTYDSISKDIIRRWAHPMAPDNNMFSDSSYSFQRENIYKEDNVRMARSSSLERDTLVGGNTTIGSNTRISRSVIARNVVIGNNVIIENSYLWEGCVIEDNVSITSAILGQGTTVGEGAVLEAGAILGARVVIDAKVTVKRFDRIHSPQEGSDEFDQDNQAQVELVGTNGRGVRFEDDSDDSDNELDIEGKTVPLNQVNSIAPAEEYLALSQRYEDDDMKDFDETESDEEEELGHDDMDAKFFREVKDTLLRGTELNGQENDVLLELSSLKLSYNINISDYAHAVYLGFFAIMGVPDEGDVKITKTLLAKLKTTFKHWALTLRKYAGILNSQMEVVQGLENACVSASQYQQFFQWCLQEIYQLDIVSGEAILDWAKLREQASGEGLTPLMLKKASTFLTWLKDAEEDDESDSDSDSDSGSDSD